MGEHLRRRPRLHQPAPVHHPHPVAQELHHGQIVGDEQEGEAVLLLEVLEEVHDLGLDGHVQGGDGLVRHQQLRLHGQGPGDGHPLPLAAGELRRVPVQVARVQPHVVHLEGGLLPEGAPGGDNALDAQGLGDDLPHPHALVQAGAGVLKDHLAGALQHPPVGPEGGGIADVDPLVQNAAAAGAVQVHHAAGDGGLAGAGLPHQAEDLPPPHLEGHAVHRPDHRSFRQGEQVGQVLDLQQNLLSHSYHLPPAA